VNECDKTAQLKPYAEEFDKAFIRVIPQLIEMLKDGSSPTSEHTIKILQTLAQHSE